MAAFSEFTIYSVTSLAAMVAMCQMRRLEYVRSEVSIPVLSLVHHPLTRALIGSEPGAGQPAADHRPDRGLHLRRVLHHRDPVPAGVPPGRVPRVSSNSSPSFFPDNIYSRCVLQVSDRCAL